MNGDNWEGPRIITVAGHVGSGKSAVCRELSKETGWPTLSTGTLFREIATRRGMSVLELNRYARLHGEIDEEVDSHLRRLADSREPVIVDSRLAWYFIPRSFKVFLVVDPSIAASRIFQALRPDERYTSVDRAYAESSERQRVEGERYRETYGVNTENWRNYDVVVDSSYASPEGLVQVIVAEAASASPLSSAPRCYLAPKRLIPTQDIRELARARPDASQGGRAQSLDPLEPVDIAVHDGSCLIVDGHARVSAAVRSGAPLIDCRLVAFQNEEILPGLSASELARTSTSTSRMYDWEDANGFRFECFPEWLIAS